MVIVVLLVVAALVVLVGRSVWERGQEILPSRCTVTGRGDAVDLDPEQARNAALIGAVGVRRKLPTQAVVIATATAVQESKLRNLDHGDRDSLGLFQQRPSQGWGTSAQVSDPTYATETFYDRLVKVRDYLDRPLTVVAQEVQRSGFPEAYADHEAEARTMADAFTGIAPGTVTCRFTPRPAKANAGRRLADDLAKVLGVRPRVTRDGFTVSTASDAGSAAVAAWVVAHAPDAQVAKVVSPDRTWTAGRDADWAPGGGRARTTTVTFTR